MYRSHYDHDVAIFSPQGRIHQIEYAMEAVKQGSATLGIKSQTHVVLAGFKRPNDDFSVHQNKIFEIDSHMGITVSGITCDARVLCNFMRNACNSYRYFYDSPMPAHRLVLSVSDKMHKPTMSYGQRPFGIGLLLGACDDSGPHLYQLCPSANYFDCIAMAIGARCQTAKTYLEKNFDLFHDASLEQLVEHAVRALNECLPNDTTLSSKNCGISVVGVDYPFSVLDDEVINDYLSKISFPVKETAGSESRDPDVEVDSTV
uniref:Proteasome subunit alpha type-1 n=1 Tax=Myxobolus squamalis TaxID=59785 RepID=A0A6B2G8A6_MYXSQ